MKDLPRKSGAQRIRFESFEADLHTEELSRSGAKVRLPHQSFCVLAMLLERAGQLVTREELRARLWPAGTLVEYDQRLNAAVNRLREALADSVEAPRFIETLPKRGYRFVAPIEPLLVPSEPVTSDLSEEPTDSSGPAHLADEPLTHRARSRRNLWLAAAAGLGAIVLVALTFSWMTHRSPTRSAFGRQIVPFTSLPGKAIAPTFSPDGSQIAFAWNEGKDVADSFDLYVKSIGSERLLRLTHQPSRWISPAWSPDGSMIAFVRQTDENAGIFVIPALGGSERSIVTGGVAVGYIQISWSPDGRRLAYSGYGPTGAPQVYIVSLETANAQPLSPAPQCMDATYPTFSPDGKQLALVCISSLAVYKVYVVGLLDGSVRALASMFGEPEGLTWAADGSRLIVANDPGDGGGLWQLTSSGEREQLPFGEDGSTPTIAPRGARMAYVRFRRAVDIWRADLTAARPEESATRLIYSTRTQIMPRYSRDGTRIAFQSNRSGSQEIWMTTAQGTDPDRLTSFNGPSTSAPSWCSDGRRIAFDSRLSGVSDIYIEDINERVPRKLATSSTNLSRPTWSEDCRWLFAIDGNNALYRIASSGGPAERIHEHLSSYCVVSADRLIYNTLESTGVVLWSKPVAGGPQTRLEGMPKVRYEDSWTATPTGIYYTDSSLRPVTLDWYDFASHSTRRLMTLKQTPVPGDGPGISVSPDGRWLLYGQSGDESSEIMLAPDR